MDAGIAQSDLTNQRVLLVDGHVRFVAVMGLASLDGKARVIVATASVFPGRGAPRRSNSVASTRVQVFRMNPFCSSWRLTSCSSFSCSPCSDQPLAEAHQRGFVGHSVLQAQAHEPPPTHPVGDQLFTLRIGQAVAVLQQAHLEKHQRRMRRMAGPWPDTSGATPLRWV